MFISKDGFRRQKVCSQVKNNLHTGTLRKAYRMLTGWIQDENIKAEQRHYEIHRKKYLIYE